MRVIKLKCVHCGVEFEYEWTDACDDPNVIYVLAECPNGHMAIVQRERSPRGKSGASEISEGEKGEAGK